MRNLRELLELFRREDRVVDIEVPVDPHLELAEVHRRIVAAGGPVLLFHNPRGARFPVVTNLFGTRRRVELAFGDRPGRFIQRLVELAETLLPPIAGKLWDARDVAFDLLKVGRRQPWTGPVKTVRSDDFQLDDLPMLTSWPEDGGPFITLPLVYTEHPDDGRHNLGMYRMQRHDARTLGMHWQIGKGGGFHHHAAEERGAALPATVFLGGPPALFMSAIAPLPENVGELTLASLLLGEKLPVVADPMGPHPLVAEAEFALCGQVPVGERRPEGPFGDHYGYYSLRHDYPVFHLDRVYHRKHAIYPATVVGKPRQEDFYLGDFLQEMLSPLFPLVMPTVRDLWSYGETGYHSLSAVVVQDRYPREAMMSAFRILGEGQLSLTKFLIMTDTPRDLRDFRGLLEHVLARAVFERDLFVFGCLSMDTLDYTGPAVNEGSKGVLLGLGDPVRHLPREFQGTLPDGARAAEVYCPGCLVVEAAPAVEDPEAARRLAAAPVFADWPLLVVVDDAARTVSSDARFLWTVFTRFEPAADLHGARLELVRNHPAFTPPVALDARLREGFPGELFCDPDTARHVQGRWREYFPGQDEPMGDSDSGHLDSA